MMRVALLLLGILTIGSTNVRALASPDAACPLESKQKSKPPSDAQIKQILIDESIAAYPGNCPCPYNVARNGSRCGRRSAYSRAGGAEPLCYPKDVSAEMVEEYRAAHPDE
jgi:sugar/nucleoside kinase (ribokinase family)